MIYNQCVDTLWPGEAAWLWRCKSVLVGVMACCLLDWMSIIFPRTLMYGVQHMEAETKWPAFHSNIIVRTFLYFYSNFPAIYSQVIMAWCWIGEKPFLATTKQLYEWYFLSVCPSVCPSVRNELRLSADDGGGYCDFMLDNYGGGQL